MDDNIAKLKKWVEESDNIVFFGGAGVSTESGIPDFRSTNGLYHQQWKYNPETILSHSFFEANPEEYYRFYRAKLMIKDVKPNITHLRLAELEKEGKLRAVVTQNIDGLHQAAGSKRVIELHGSLLRAYCSKCG
ncbi:MAG: NAD-dependent protein deacylase, partial [Oscillospiraceae bacterium]|nr:NAD-dependent protein deacylase [Oscillospiraceae bacterium]